MSAVSLIEAVIRDDQVEDAVRAYEADHDEDDEPSNDDAKKYLTQLRIVPEVRAINRFHELWNARAHQR